MKNETQRWQTGEAERCRIIFGDPNAMKGGNHKGYNSLPLKALEELVSSDLIDLAETQNDSPSVEQFLGFMRQWPFVKAHGYVIGDTRADARVSIEGLECEKSDVPAKRLVEFRSAWLDFNRHADEFAEFRSWWD